MPVMPQKKKGKRQGRGKGELNSSSIWGKTKTEREAMNGKRKLSAPTNSNRKGSVVQEDAVGG